MDKVTNPSLSLIIHDRRLVDVSGRFFVLNGTASGNGLKNAAIVLQRPVQPAPGNYHVTTRLEDQPSAIPFIPDGKQVGALPFDVVENEHQFLRLVHLGIKRVF